MIPDPKKHTPTKEAFLSLRKRINASAKWIAEHSGISQRRIEYLAVGKRADGSVASMSYPEQFTLECLAEHAERIPGKKFVRN